MDKLRVAAFGVFCRKRAETYELLVQCPDSEEFYRFPGGTIEIGETASEAIVREMREEYELDVVVDNLWVVSERFFVRQSQQRHCISFLHFCSIEESDEFVELRHKEHEDVKILWRSLGELRRRLVYPEGIEKYFNFPTQQIVHLISRSFKETP